MSRGLVLDLEWMSCGACTLVVLSGVVSRFFAYFFGSVFDSQVSTISLSSKEDCSTLGLMAWDPGLAEEFRAAGWECWLEVEGGALVWPSCHLTRRRMPFASPSCVRDICFFGSGGGG